MHRNAGREKTPHGLMDSGRVLQNLSFDNVFLAIVPLLVKWCIEEKKVLKIQCTSGTPFSDDLYNTIPKQHKTSTQKITNNDDTNTHRKNRFYIRKQFPITYELCVCVCIWVYECFLLNAKQWNCTVIYLLT